MNRIVVDEARCCGCGACADVCPRGAIMVQENADGFLMPVIREEKCIDCGLCSKVCQFQQEKKTERNICSLHALKCRDRATVLSSSSGGAFTALSDCVLAAGGVIVGAVMDEAHIVRHVFAENAEQRDAMRESKYVQSDTRGVFKAVRERLNKGQLVMFVGTPCQAASLRSYLQGKDERLLLVDFLCHGVPSQKLFSEHVRLLEKQLGRKVDAYSFRRKNLGWDPAHTESVRLVGSRKYICTDRLQGYTRLFNTSLSLRESCFHCPYRSQYRHADLTIADFWGIEQMTGKVDKTGVSLVAVSTERGRVWFNRAQGQADVTEIPLEKALHCIPLKPVKRKDKVDAFREELRVNGYEAAMRKYTATGTIKSRVRFTLKKIKRKVFDVER